MTDAQYTAKVWLSRLNDYADKLKAEKRTLEMLQTRLFRGVSNYDGYTGRADPMTRRAAHEDALIDFSEQTARVEKAQKEYLAEVAITREVIEAIPIDLQALAIDRYINGYKWEQLEDLYHYGKSMLFRFNADILDNVAEVLAVKKVKLEITTINRKRTAAV